MMLHMTCDYGAVWSKQYYMHHKKNTIKIVNYSVCKYLCTYLNNYLVPARVQFRKNGFALSLY